MDGFKRFGEAGWTLGLSSQKKRKNFKVKGRVVS